MQFLKRYTTPLCAIVLLASALSSCGKSDAPGTANANKDSLTTNPALDTSQPAKQVEVDSAHVIYFRPKVGDIRRYRILHTTNATVDINDQLMGGPSIKQNRVDRVEFIIRQEIKAVNADSTVDASYFIEKAEIDQRQDTSRFQYSSSNEAHRKDKMFEHVNSLLNKEIKVKYSNHGDPRSVTGTEAIAAQLIQGLPDSVKKYPQVKGMAQQQIDGLVGQSVMRIFTLLPVGNVGKDSVWTSSRDQNVPITQQIQLPMVQKTSDAVRGFEERMGRVVAVIESNSSLEPKKTVIEEGDVKATLANFRANVKSVNRVEDATGMTVHKTITNTRSNDFKIESKQQASKMYHMINKAQENLTVELLP